MEPSTRDLAFEFKHKVNKEESYITAHEASALFNSDTSLRKLSEALHGSDPANMSEAKLTFIDTDEMISDEIKVLIDVQDTIYHFFIDSLTAILKIYKKSPDVKFILYVKKTGPGGGVSSFYELLFLILDGEGVNYTVVSPLPGESYAPIYKFNNYIIMDESVLDVRDALSFLDVEYMADLAVKYSRESTGAVDSAEPFRKLYISRVNASSELGPVVEGYSGYKDDLRMNDSWKLDKFFASMGYDVLVPEKHFGSIMEQITYMSEVKTLASITSSGLANMIFMQPSQTVIEMQAELVQVIRFDDHTAVTPLQKLHDYYSTLSFMRGHTYVGIPSRRDPDKVIKTLTSGSGSCLI
jgi:hypothetical protein